MNSKCRQICTRQKLGQTSQSYNSTLSSLVNFSSAFGVGNLNFSIRLKPLKNPTEKNLAKKAPMAYQKKLTDQLCKNYLRGVGLI